MNIINGCLLVSIDVDTDDADIISQQQSIVKQVHQHRLKQVIMDLSSVQIIDSAQMRMLDNTMKTLSLLGAESLLAGIRPELAAVMAELKSNVINQLAVLTVEDGLTRFRQMDQQARALNAATGSTLDEETDAETVDDLIEQNLPENKRPWV